MHLRSAVRAARQACSPRYVYKRIVHLCKSFFLFSPRHFRVVHSSEVPVRLLLPRADSLKTGGWKLLLLLEDPRREAAAIATEAEAEAEGAAVAAAQRCKKLWEDYGELFGLQDQWERARVMVRKV